MPVPAEVEMHRQPGERVDAAERSEPRDGWRQSLVGREPGEPLIQRLAAREQAVDCCEEGNEHQLGALMLKALRGQPLMMGPVPGGIARIHATLDEQQLRDAMASTGEIPADLLARAREMTDRLKPSRRHHHRLE